MASVLGKAAIIAEPTLIGPGDEEYVDGTLNVCWAEYM